jgi:hypothetical protein
MIKNDFETAIEQARGTHWYRGNPVTVGALSKTPPVAPGEAPRYRVGNHQPQNIYDGDKYIGVMFSAPHAARVVDALNASERAAAAEKWNRDAL